MNNKHTKNCYMTCIPEYALVPKKLAWLHQFRAIFVRYCHYARNYLSFAQFVTAQIAFKKV